MDAPRHSGPPVNAAAGKTPSSNAGALVAIAIVALHAVGGGGAAGAAYWRKKANAPTAPGVPPAAAESVPRPPGRKDLPPIESGNPQPPAAAPETSGLPSGVPSALPSTRTPPPPKPAGAGAARPKPAAPSVPADDLSNIGRR
jgi:hypothetical protein